MDANQACDIVVNTVKASSLNFLLQESPFAITINIKKTFIKNQSGIKSNPDIYKFSCFKCNATAENYPVKDTTVSENDEKHRDVLDKTIQELSNKLEKATKELSEVMEDKEKLLVDLANITKEMHEKNEKHEIEIKQCKDEAKKKDEELIKESKRSKTLSENLNLAEAQLENTKHQEKDLVYNVEINNNFETLHKHADADAENTINKKEGKRKFVDHSNYKGFLKDFLENFKENLGEEPKYPKAALKMIENGHNIFHVSLLDVGLYNPNLKAFLNGHSREDLHKIEKDCKELIMTFGKDLGKGSFKSDTSVFINPKNYGQTLPKNSN